MRQKATRGFNFGRKLIANLLHATTSLSETVLCSACGEPLRIDSAGVRKCCATTKASIFEDGIIKYDTDLSARGKLEMRARDRQAHSYLKHVKFPIQIYRIKNFVKQEARQSRVLPVLDLGCGPGPTTAILLAAGFKVVAIDISMQSLALNFRQCEGLGELLCIQADLTRIGFAGSCAGGLMMADFLQHLGNAKVRRKFLAEAFNALVPGGWFFLSCFNVNVKHRIKRDIDGAYGGGEIPYHRFTILEVLDMLPSPVTITDIQPMNIFHGVMPDRLATQLPFARHLARMIVICGRKSKEQA